MDSRAAIGPITGIVDRCNSGRQLPGLGFAWSVPSLPPAIITAPRDLLGAVQHAYLVLVPVRFQEGIDLCFRSKQNRIAFFGRVSSSFKTRFSCSTWRRRFNSATCLASNPSSPADGKQPLASFLAPPGQHEGLDSQRFSHLPHLEARQAAQGDCFCFEFNRLLADLSWP